MPALPADRRCSPSFRSCNWAWARSGLPWVTKRCAMPRAKWMASAALPASRYDNASSYICAWFIPKSSGWTGVACLARSAKAEAVNSSHPEGMPVGNPFFERPILNSPYEYPIRHWELDDQGQPTQRTIETRRRAEFITPIPKPRKQKGKAVQQPMVFDEGKGLSTEEQQYDPTSIVNKLRDHVDQWRN